MSNLDNTGFLAAEAERFRQERHRQRKPLPSHAEQYFGAKQENPVAAQRKTKIVFEQEEITTGHFRYRVVNLTNRTNPKIGAQLKEEEVQHLISESESLSVEIKPSSNKRTR